MTRLFSRSEQGAPSAGCSVDSINREYAKRLRSLLSVDDLVVELEARKQSFLSHFKNLKPIILPRQARDRHRQS
jgi:hypothetical protein